MIKEKVFCISRKPFFRVEKRSRMEVAHVSPEVVHSDRKVAHPQPEVAHLEPRVVHVPPEVAHAPLEVTHLNPKVAQPLSIHTSSNKRTSPVTACSA